MRLLLFLSILLFVPPAGLLQAQTAADADFDGSGEVDFADFLMFVQAYGSTEGRYNLGGDERVNFVDFLTFAQVFGQTVEQQPDGPPRIEGPTRKELRADENTVVLYHFNGDFNDFGPNRLHLTVEGNARLVDGNLGWMENPDGQVLRIRDVGDRVTVAIPDSLIMPGKGALLTIETWIYPRAYKAYGVGNHPVIAMHQSWDTRLEVMDRTWNWSRSPGVEGGKNAVLVAPKVWKASVGPDAWHFLRITLDAEGRVEVYLDGILMGTGTVSMNYGRFNAWVLTLGNFDGDIDEVRVSNVVRTGSEPPGPDLIISVPSFLDFGEVAAGRSDRRVFQVTNRGDAPADGIEVAISGEDAGAFSVSPAEIAIGAGQSRDVMVKFSPVSSGTRSATLSISDRESGSGNLFKMSMSGMGLAPEIEVASALNIGDVTVGQRVFRTLVVSNRGNADLHITDIVPSDSAFAISPKAMVVPAGESRAVEVTVVPATADGGRTTLVILSNDPDESPALVRVGNQEKSGVMIDIEAANELHDVHPTVLGGNEVLTLASTLWKAYETFKEDGLRKMSWRVHINDDAYGWRWDTNTIDRNARHRKWLGGGGLNGLVNTDVALDESYELYVDVVDHAEGNHFKVDFWDATDMGHSGVVIKSPEAANAYRKIKVNPSARPAYVRLDVKIDSERPFRSEESGWVLLQAVGSGKPRLHVRFTEDRRFDVRFGETDRLALSEQLDLDRYYSLEVYYGDAECAYWVDGVEVDRQAVGTGGGVDGLQVGSVGSGKAGVEGQIHVDAIRVDTDYIGSNVRYPWAHAYRGAFTFDNTLRSVDDIARLAERLGTTVVWTIPVPNKGRASYQENSSDNGFEWQTVQFYADLVEYLNGQADADFSDKVQHLDWSHHTPSDNWANLRAHRGRVKPYGERYFEIGNEPYSNHGGWRANNDIAGYGHAFVRYAQALKAVDPTIVTGHASFRNAPDNWHDTLLPITHDTVDFINLFHDYPAVKGEPFEYWLGIPVGSNNRWRYWMGNKGAWQNRSDYGHYFYFTPYLAQDKINQYLSDRPDRDEIFLTQTEYGYFLAAGKGEDNWLGSAINRASWIGANIEANVRFAHAWSLVTNGGFSMGMVVDRGSSIEKPPHYYVFQLWANHFGEKLVQTDLTTDMQPFRGSVRNETKFDIPYYSAWSSVSREKDRLYVIFINRDQSNSVTAQIDLSHFNPSGALKVFTINGDHVGDDNEVGAVGERMTWWLPAGDGNDDPENIVIREQALSGVRGSSFTYTFPKLSVTALEIDGRVVD